ncbi:type II toxin-antitoxin system RelE/ParE family toxin [Flavobacteriaceae bacterium AH-315-O20]|nr:type II toxin-antitoxin system RelE/ParE family toxin [Flavobacteriaceae bacterium AH-315-O20]
MAVYKLSNKAEIDLVGMYEFGVYKFGLQQTQKYFFGIHATFGILAENMDLGRDASEYIENLKRFTYKAHTIFYLISANGIFILRVLSQRMDYDSNLSGT